MTNRCINRCEFIRFGEGRFYCKFYKDDLVSELGAADKKLYIFRCEECMREGEIGHNTTSHSAKKVKKHLGLIMDSFYSFKDEIETEVTEAYRILKKLEEEK